MLVHPIAVEGLLYHNSHKHTLIICMQRVRMTLLLRFLSNATEQADEVDCIVALAMSASTITLDALDVKQSSDVQELTTSSAAQEPFSKVK